MLAWSWAWSSTAGSVIRFDRVIGSLFTESHVDPFVLAVHHSRGPKAHEAGGLIQAHLRARRITRGLNQAEFMRAKRSKWRMDFMRVTRVDALCLTRCSLQISSTRETRCNSVTCFM